MSDYLWKSLLTEFAGTYTLVLLGGSAVALSASQGGSLLVSGLTFGLALTALIYSWEQFSGAHFNPAVSLGFAVSGQMNWGLMIGYWISQFAGAIAAGATILGLFGQSSGVGASTGSLTNSATWEAMLIEALITFLIVITYLFMYSDSQKAGSSALAIGLIYVAVYLAFASLTGASGNPARSLGPGIFAQTLDSYWAYIIGPFIGAIAASLVYMLLRWRTNCQLKTDKDGNVVTDSCGRPIEQCEVYKINECGETISDCKGTPEVMMVEKPVDPKPGHMQRKRMSIKESIEKWSQKLGVNEEQVRAEIKTLASKVKQKILPGTSGSSSSSSS
jgi:MIP family channel proteins